MCIYMYYAYMFMYHVPARMSICFQTCKPPRAHTAQSGPHPRPPLGRRAPVRANPNSTELQRSVPGPSQQPSASSRRAGLAGLRRRRGISGVKVGGAADAAAAARPQTAADPGFTAGALVCAAVDADLSFYVYLLE